MFTNFQDHRLISEKSNKDRKTPKLYSMFQVENISHESDGYTQIFVHYLSSAPASSLLVILGSWVNYISKIYWIYWFLKLYFTTCSRKTYLLFDGKMEIELLHITTFFRYEEIILKSVEVIPVSVFIILSWVIFRSDTIPDSAYYIEII